MFQATKSIVSSSVRRLVNATGYEIRRKGFSDPQTVKVDFQALMSQQEIMAKHADMDADFFPILEAVRPYTMTSIERLFDLYKSVEYIIRAGITGDILECGVWRGGGMMLVAHTLQKLGDTNRALYLYDTFEGHPRPDPEKDVDLWGNIAHQDWLKYRKTDETSTWAEVSVDEVRANMESTSYPADKVKLVKGMVEKTATETAPKRASIVRLDTDWYESSRVGLEAFWPRMPAGGVLIVDDYGHYKGQRQAVDEFFADKPVKFNRVDYSCRTIIKPD